MIDHPKFEPATDKQLAFMEELGIEIPAGLSKSAAIDLIKRELEEQKRGRVLGGDYEPMSDAQKRRFRFYGLYFDQDTSKQQATDIITKRNREFPGEEQQYQKWKSRLPSWDEFGERSARNPKAQSMIKEAKDTGIFQAGIAVVVGAILFSLWYYQPKIKLPEILNINPLVGAFFAVPLGMFLASLLFFFLLVKFPKLTIGALVLLFIFLITR